MIFNDYVIGLNGQFEELERIQEIIIELDKVLDLHQQWVGDTFREIFNGRIAHTVNSNYAANSVELVKVTNEYFQNLRESLISIDFMEFGEILSNFKNLGLKDMENETNKIYEELKSSYKIIHSYRAYKDNTLRVDEYNNCINAIKNMRDIFEKFNYAINCINLINEKLYLGEQNEGLEIRLLDEGIEKDTYDKVVDPLYKIYDKLYEISGIENAEKLEIVRIETGSLFFKFLGNKTILNLITKLLENFHNFMVRNYTRDGQKKNLVESTDLFKSQFDILKEMKELGLNVSESEEIAKETLVFLMKQSNILLSSSPDIKINAKVLSKSDEIKNILKSKEYTLLEDNQSISK